MWSETEFATRVIEGENAEVRLVPWRRVSQQPNGRAKNGPALDLNPGKPPSLVVNEEVQSLRARLEDMAQAAEARSRDAYQEGLRAGEAAAREALEEERRAAFEGMTAAIAQAASLRPETIRRAEADTVRLAIEIARRVLHREISVDPSSLEALIRAALAKLKNQEILRVRVHPGQEQLVRASLEHAGRSAAIEVHADPGCARGTVSFEIGRGALDASVDAQLREIERGLTDELQIRS